MDYFELLNVAGLCLNEFNVLRELGVCRVYALACVLVHRELLNVAGLCLNEFNVLRELGVCRVYALACVLVHRELLNVAGLCLTSLMFCVSWVYVDIDTH